jgi:hypothetical protein
MGFDQAPYTPTPPASYPPPRRRVNPWLLAVLVVLLLLCCCCASTIGAWARGDDVVAAWCRNDRAAVEDVFGTGACNRVGIP